MGKKVRITTVCVDPFKDAVLCWRCGKVETRKRVDGKPVCLTCFTADAYANRGIAPSYGDLTPVGVKHIPDAEKNVSTKTTKRGKA